jgi:hypothetical protein
LVLRDQLAQLALKASLPLSQDQLVQLAQRVLQDLKETRVQQERKVFQLRALLVFVGKLVPRGKLDLKVSAVQQVQLVL